MIRYTDKKPIPDWAQHQCMHMVSPAFKAIVEAIEPGIHQFIPVRYIGTHKVHLADMWFMVVCNRIDSIDRTHSTMRFDNYWRDYPLGRIVFNNAQIGTAHMWRDKFIMPASTFMSDEMGNALISANLTGFVYGKPESV